MRKITLRNPFQLVSHVHMNIPGITHVFIQLYSSEVKSWASFSVHPLTTQNKGLCRRGPAEGAYSEYSPLGPICSTLTPTARIPSHLTALALTYMNDYVPRKGKFTFDRVDEPAIENVHGDYKLSCD